MTTTISGDYAPKLHPRPERSPTPWVGPCSAYRRRAQNPGPEGQEMLHPAGKRRAGSPGAEGWKVQSRSAEARPGSLAPSAEGLST